MEVAKNLSMIDRGGLFKINDDVFVFFHSIEFQVRKHLELIMQTQVLTSEAIVDEVLNDIDVQFHWSALSGDIDEKASQMLLKEIVQLWLSIRGFSEVGAFMEQYI